MLPPRIDRLIGYDWRTAGAAATDAARRAGLSINVVRPAENIGIADADARRLNVVLDRDGRVVRFIQG